MEDLGGPEPGGAPEGAPEAAAPEAAPSPEPGGAPELAPESIKRDNLKILVEQGSLTEDDSYIDLSKGKNSLGDIEVQLGKLLKD
jgi:hypothetical protein